MKPFDLLLLSTNYIENKEGVVITFSNGKMAKLKNLQYMLLHGLLTDGLLEHNLVSKILNSSVDDLLALIPKDSLNEREYINEMENTLLRHINDTIDYCMETFNKNKFLNRKEFAIKFKDDNNFHYLIKMFSNNSYEYLKELIIKNILFKCRRLELAREFLSTLCFERSFFLLDQTEDN